MIVRLITTNLALALISSALAGGAGAPPGKPTFREVPCSAALPADRCGYVKVPLDHAQPRGKQIELFVAVSRANVSGTTLKAVPDPLFYLEGGPGGSSSDSVPALGAAFKNRDVVGIDQRGVGRSRPTLNCPQLDALSKRDDLKSAQVSPLSLAGAVSCGQKLRADGVALENFNTAQAALDIDWVRRALGYDQINVYGLSYGTRLAQELLRRAPGHLRAVILDSVIPPTLDLIAQTPLAVQTAFERVLNACALDADCNTKYPNLEATYRAALKQLDAKPLMIKMKGGGELESFALQGLILSSMYFPQGLSEIPSLIVAAKNGDAGTIKASLAVKLAEDRAKNGSLTRGAFYSNVCRDEVAYSSPAQLRAGLNAAPEFAKALSLAPGLASPDLFTICQKWKLTVPAALENEAVTSNVPILLLAGEFDPVTPPEWLPAASAKFTRSYSVVISGAAHGSGLTTACGYGIVTQFLQNPQQAPNTACAELNKIIFR
ncbi:alpha/beta fold hydrolase [Deinococcus psychrotolerans]|nr:alpha/beta fold hydrolase [Deinococcus psychrotolerans]